MAGRRKHFRIDELGLRETVTALLAKGHTYREVADELERQGHGVGVSSVHRFNSELQRKTECIVQAKETAMALVAALKKEGVDDSEPDTEMMDLLIASISHNLLAATADDGLKTKELVGLAMAIAKIASSKSQVEKLKQSARKQFAEAWKQATAELRGLLESTGLWPDVEAVLAKHNPTEVAP